MTKYQRHFGHGRLNLIFEAVDSGDTDLYWTDRKAWMIKHGYSGMIDFRGERFYVPVGR